MKTYIVASVIEGIQVAVPLESGIARFVTYFSGLLRTAGEAVTLLLIGEKRRVIDPAWAATYQAWGIDLVQVVTPPQGVFVWPALPALRISEEIATQLSGADIVYFQDRGGPAFHIVRTRRFRLNQRPVCVTLLHGPSALLREGANGYPSVMGDLNVDFVEAYAARHSDFVVATSGAMLDWARANSWQLPERVCLLEPPDHAGEDDDNVIRRQWLEFHAEVCDYARRPTPKLSFQPAPTQPRAPSVDICVPYFNAPKYLPQLLLSLEHQTSQDFNVIVMDDGSTDSEARRVFDEMRLHYEPRGWLFFRQENAFPGAARNAAARRGSAEYICFFDSDDVAAPNMVERFLEAMRLSSDDCLVSPCYSFQGDEMPYDVATGQVTVAPRFLYMPPGDSRTASVIDNMHGGPAIMIRRTVFEAVGGFTEDRGIGYEDYEFHLMLTMAGYKMDVLPEYLQFYRHVGSGVSRVTDLYHNGLRVLRVYQKYLNRSNLGLLAPALRGLYWQAQALSERIDELEPAVEKPAARRPPPTKRLKILMLLPHFSWPPVTGGLRRAWAQISYFGARHDLTVLTFGQRGSEEMLQKALCTYAQEAIVVPYDAPIYATDKSLPQKVRELVNPEMEQALRSVQPPRFDVALVAQIFVAEYRNLLDTFCVLNEENIESNVLRQTARLDDSPALEMEAELMRRYEDRMWPQFPLRFTVSDADKRAMDGRCAAGETVVIENGTDTDCFVSEISPRSKAILFMGTMDYFPNIDGMLYFAHDIWPRIHEKEPAAHLIIAGRNPPQSIQDLALQPGIWVIATPESMAPIAKECTLSVVPLRVGGGTRLKIIQAMAMGLPVVSTSLGCEGLAVEDGVHLLIRDDPVAFADAILELMANPNRWIALQNNGRTLAQERYDWQNILEKMERALFTALEAPHPRPFSEFR